MRAFRNLCLVSLALLSIASLSVAVEVDGYRAPGVFDAAAARAEMAAMGSWLVAEQTEAAAISVTVPAEDLALIQGDGLQAERKMLVGVTRPVNALVDLEDLAFGAQRATKSGRVWSGSVHAAGASALRIHFTDVHLPVGAELYVYNATGQAFGPFTGRGPLDSGEFWANAVSGETVMVQLRGAAADTYFTIADVGYMGDRFLYAEYTDRESAEKSFCSYNASCVENAACGSDAAVNTAEDAVAHYTFVKRPYIYMCTGGLIADEAQSGTPYFLTANHCLSRAKEAGTVETYFFYRSACGSCDSPGAANTVGAAVVATNSTSDYTIMQLNGSAPSGAAFLGWNTSDVAFSNGYNLYRISHPSGAPQAYSEHQVDTSKVVCGSWPRGAWIYSHDTYGATEGGSSGSPVVNSQGQVVGQLTGACGYNLGDVCDADSNGTVDGAFANYYDEVASFLGGGGTTCDDADGDGYDDEACGGNDCNDGDFYVNPGVAEVCDDFIDNNCDGQIDEDCGGGECLPKGDPCSTGSECCSGLCHPRKLTCK